MLKLCLNNQDGSAPKDFKAPAGTGLVVFVLQARPTNE